MKATVIAVVCALLCGCSATPRGASHTVRPHGTSADAIQLGPESKDEALAIARQYMKDHHKDLDISQRSPSTQYFAKATHDGKPLWVVGFGVPKAPGDKSFRTHYTFGLWVREDGDVETTFTQSP